MKEFIHRLFSDTPKFFKKLQILGASIAGLGLSLSGIQGVPPNVVSIAGHLVWVGGAIVAVAQFAVKNTTNETHV